MRIAPLELIARKLASARAVVEILEELHDDMLAEQEPAKPPVEEEEEQEPAKPKPAKKAKGRRSGAAERNSAAVMLLLANSPKTRAAIMREAKLSGNSTDTALKRFGPEANGQALFVKDESTGEWQLTPAGREALKAGGK